MTAKDRWHGFVHFLYNPAGFGRLAYRNRWDRLHTIQLIPGSWLERSCDRYDAYLEGKERQK